METTLKILKEHFEADGVEVRRSDLAFATVPAARALDALKWLRDDGGYGHLVVISCVDLIEDGLFRLVYLVHSYSSSSDIGVCVEIPRQKPSMESAHRLWAAGRVYQRELKEMFGIDFPGSPEVDLPMILEGWDDIPVMRRDFDTLEYARKTFYRREGRGTRDPAGEMEERRYPEEGEVKREIKRLSRKRYGRAAEKDE